MIAQSFIQLAPLSFHSTPSNPFSPLLDQLQSEIQQFSQANEQLRCDVEALHKSSTAEEQSYLTSVHHLQEQIQQLQTIVSSSLPSLSHAQCDDRDHKREEIKETAGRIEELEARAQESELTRRRLHNTFQELRGNLRVIARVRPPLLSDRINGRSPAVWVEGDATVCVKYKEKTTRFTYDGAFGTDSTQEEVFDEVSNFVQSALDGYDVCLFTYGQTGSGKTYTMQGVGEEEARGIVPRSIEKIMAEVERLRDVGWEYSLEVSFVEIYREVVRDLLVRDARPHPKIEVKFDVGERAEDEE